MRRQTARYLLLVLACLVQFGYAAAQGTPDPWYARQAKPKNIDPPMTFVGAFSIELPKDWQLAPGHTMTVFSSVEKKRGTEAGGLITLEQIRLQAPLDPALIAAASDVELREVQIREATGTGFTHEVKRGPFGQIIFIQYNRPGLWGTQVHVVQYSIPIGTTMYRLICIAPTAAVEKYRPIFAHVAASFTPVKGATVP